VGLQTAAEWLRLSIYFLTVWDIIVGTLCLLNSAYILYKICENPNRGRVGETRFRTALVRLFGRKKETPMPTRMSREEMPLQPMPSAPPHVCTYVAGEMYDYANNCENENANPPYKHRRVRRVIV
jgi:hypothetical protein